MKMNLPKCKCSHCRNIERQQTEAEARLAKKQALVSFCKNSYFEGGASDTALMSKAMDR